MKYLIGLVSVLLVLSFGVSTAQANAQITLQNNSKYQLNLYIDHNFGCGPALPRGFCTSSITAGLHLLEAKKGEEIMRTEENVNIGEGSSPVWTVTIEDQWPLEGKWMVKSDWRTGKDSIVGEYLTITHSGDGYILKSQKYTGACP